MLTPPPVMPARPVRRGLAHAVHATLTFCTLGFYGLVWVAMVILNDAEYRGAVQRYPAAYARWQFEYGWWLSEYRRLYGRDPW